MQAADAHDCESKTGRWFTTQLHCHHPDVPRHCFLPNALPPAAFPLSPAHRSSAFPSVPLCTPHLASSGLPLAGKASSFEPEFKFPGSHHPSRACDKVATGNLPGSYLHNTTYGRLTKIWFMQARHVACVRSQGQAT